MDFSTGIIKQVGKIKTTKYLANIYFGKNVCCKDFWFWSGMVCMSIFFISLFILIVGALQAQGRGYTCIISEALTSGHLHKTCTHCQCCAGSKTLIFKTKVGVMIDPQQCSSR